MTTMTNPSSIPSKPVGSVIVERVKCPAVGCGKFFAGGDSLKSHIANENRAESMARNGGNHQDCLTGDLESHKVQATVQCNRCCSDWFIDRNELKLHRNKSTKHQRMLQEQQAAQQAAAQVQQQAQQPQEAQAQQQPSAQTLAQPASLLAPARKSSAHRKLSHAPVLEKSLLELRDDFELMTAEVRRLQAEKRSYEEASASKIDDGSLVIDGITANQASMEANISQRAADKKEEQASVVPALKKKRVMAKMGKMMVSDDEEMPALEAVQGVSGGSVSRKIVPVPFLTRFVEPIEPVGTATTSTAATSTAASISTSTTSTFTTSTATSTAADSGSPSAWENLCRIGSALPDTLFISAAIDALPPSSRGASSSAHARSIKKMAYHNIMTLGTLRLLSPALVAQMFALEFFGDDLLFLNCLYAFRGGL